MTKVLFFGCIGRAGHFMWRPGGRERWDTTTPWGQTPDGNLAPHDDPKCQFPQKSFGCICSQKQGIGVIRHKDGWTALSFWDRTIDSRRGCNGNLFAEGLFGFAEMCELALKHFPEVASRESFPREYYAVPDDRKE